MWSDVSANLMEFPQSPEVSKSRTKYLIVFELFTRWIDVNSVPKATETAVTHAHGGNNS